jgi:peroxiredoxin
LVGLRTLARVFPTVHIFAISLDRPAESRELAMKIAKDGRGELGFPLLFDPRAATIDRYGLRDPEYANQKLDGVPRPAVFVLDREGKVRWAKIESDYRERPTTEEVAGAIDAFE